MKKKLVSLGVAVVLLFSFWGFTSCSVDTPDVEVATVADLTEESTTKEAEATTTEKAVTEKETTARNETTPKEEMSTAEETVTTEESATIEDTTVESSVTVKNHVIAKRKPTTTSKGKQVVFLTPKEGGYVYHYVSACVDSFEKFVPLDNAKAQGYEPCEKCVPQ